VSGQYKIASRISTFVDIYIKTLHLVAPELDQSKDIDLGIAQEVILENLVSHITKVNTGYQSAYLTKVTHFLALVMSPPLPFVNKGVNQVEFTKILLEVNDKLSVEESETRYNVASILAPQNSEISALILSMLGSQITEGMLKWNDPKTVNNREAIRWANFWINLSADPKVRARLQHDNLPIKLYTLIKMAEESDKIIKEFNGDYLTLLVELIMRVSAGNKEIE
jgi:hypothetical protein